MPESSTGKGLLENWKCLLACTLVSMSPFQYGIDFGAIGGLQAMPGFLEVDVPRTSNSSKLLNSDRFSDTETLPVLLATTSLQLDNSSYLR